jgi:hypothetical protein
MAAAAPAQAAGPVWMQQPALPYIVPPPGPAAPKLPPHRYLHHKTPSHCLDMLIRGEIPMPPGQPRRYVVGLHPLSFDGEPDTSDSPLLYMSRYSHDAHRRCCFRHYHETLSSLVQTMFRIDMRHRRLRNMSRRRFFKFSTFNHLIDMFYYDDLGPAGCRIHLLGGVSMYQDECTPDAQMPFRFGFNRNNPRFQIQDQAVIQRPPGVPLRRWNHVADLAPRWQYSAPVADLPPFSRGTQVHFGDVQRMMGATRQYSQTLRNRMAYGAIHNLVGVTYDEQPNHAPLAGTFPLHRY